ncbi:MAG: uncharacterized protein PWQ80_859 [Thermotoga sp.]|nr:uncharacterized protein [Thermotoga sp.]
MYDQIIERLEIQMNRMISYLPEKRRLFFQDLEERFTPRAILLYGPRGTGKTTFLLSMAKKNGFLYVSDDDLSLLNVSFHELAQEILKNYPGIVIDEVHFLKNWSVILKVLYDTFPGKTIWVSDSSSIVMKKGTSDLSRRFVLMKLPLMSFREFIHFETGKVLEKLNSPFVPLSDYAASLMKQVDVMSLFRDYREKGTRPFYREGNFRERMMNILDKTIYYDIPHLIGTVTENHIGVMKAIVGHLLYSRIPTINIESMSREWGVGKQKLYQLLHVMEEIELVNIVRKERAEKPFSKGSKIFLADPSMYHVFEGETGNFREAFVVFALKEKGKIYASKNEEEADFIFEGMKLEVGGKRKKRKSSDFVIRDDIDLPVRNSIPMWVLGMLW